MTQHKLEMLQIPFKNSRTTVEMEPHSGEMYAMQGGGRMAKTSRIRDDMILHRRPTHISEAR